MKEHPILFNAEMVRAILDGRKTQTRRALRPQPPKGITYHDSNNGKFQYHYGPDVYAVKTIHCPYGVPSDRLFVKENHYLYGYWERKPLAKKEKYRFKPIQPIMPRYFENPPDTILPKYSLDRGWNKRSSLFLAKNHTRVWLEVTNVRVERLGDITEADILAEGIFKWPLGYGRYTNYEKKETVSFPRAGLAYADLWDSTNGPGSVYKNPWVWVIEFKKVTA